MNEETNQQSAPLANQHLANKIAGIVNDKGEIITNEDTNTDGIEIESQELESNNDSESDESETSNECTVDTDALSDETTKEDAQN